MATNDAVVIEVGVGELIDKITILVIKSERMKDPVKLANVRHELEVLMRAREGSVPNSVKLNQLEAELKAVNSRLWNIEDEIRACEAAKDFGARFIDLARSVYIQNDSRAMLKKQINELCGSSIIEEKSYTEFQ